MNISQFRRAALGCALATGITLTGIGGALTTAAEAAPAAVTASATASATEHVIVIGQPGRMAAAQAAVDSHGGTITRTLPIVDGVAAIVPARAESALRATPGVKAVTPDAAGHLMAVDPTLGYDVQTDDGSMNLTEQVTGATKAWQAGYTGKGVDVALIDSGVAPVQGLASGNVINGPDLSFDSQSADLRYLDAFGHGTHMASIIAGRDTTQPSTWRYASDTSHFYGVAPDARIVSVKVAAADGSADVSQVIAAINWVDQNAHSNGLNIRVLNLSFGTNSTQDYTVDPLAYAAEQAWRHGIVVVVSGGNDGHNDRLLADPAYDPYLLAVGASDPNGTVGTSDDTVAPFSSRGTGSRHVDVVAPGVHVLGLRDPNSYVDTNNASARVGTRFFRGSGTSQATAVVSGCAALLLQKYPGATPDQIKRQLMATAAQFAGASNTLQGNGVVQVYSAIVKTLTSNAQTGPAAATGTGSLDAARGGLDVQDDAGNVLTGEQDIFGQPWNPASWVPAVANSSTWKDGVWNSSTWTGSSWTSTSWTGKAWASSSWTSSSWAGISWANQLWASHSWMSSSWTSSSWTDDCWRSSTWSSSSWADSAWSSSSWADSAWSSSVWG